MIENIEHLVLSGGGLLGISYLGIFRYLEEFQAGITDTNARLKLKLKSISGCSAGALFGAMFAVGYTSTEIYDIIKAMNFKDYIKITADSILGFMQTKGFESGSTTIILIKNQLLEKTGSANITFKEVFDRYNIILKIGVTNLTHSKFQMLDYTTNPDLPIYQAINASIAIPFVFEPVIIGDELFCDGGLLDNLPIDYVINNSRIDLKSNSTCDARDPENENIIQPINTLGIYLTNTSDCINAANYKQSTIYQYLNSVFHAAFIHPTQCKKALEKDKNYKIVIIEIPCDIMTFLKLNASHEDIDNIISIAYDTISKECNLHIQSTSINHHSSIIRD